MEPAGVENLQAMPSRRAVPGLYAGFWRRVAAWLVDALLVAALDAAFTLSFGTALLVAWAMLGGIDDAAMTRLVDIALQPFGAVLAWLYFAVCETSRWQATPGKRVLGLRVVDERGRRIGFARASARCFGKILSVLLLGIGFLLAGWTARKQALHDLVAGCCVVRKNGFAAWQRGQGAQVEAILAQAAPAHAGMPGWAVALVVIVGCVLVVPVLAILAMVAIPVYEGHAVREEIAQGVASTERPRALIAQYIGERGALPRSNADLGLPRPETIQARYVSSIRVADGKVVVTYGNEAARAIHGGHVVISPVGNAAMLRWLCSSPDIRETLLPSNCRD
ncbi:MAG: RDD family protein [Xanthomonadales bacterium]|nr:RDD family protein [Xanthomonadales bacterium]ODU94616.1 MAG: hypothetical protein ABT18_03000 [Rhodanobacter sp. SCN 66-43]OJY85198.1 MAG: hypothetical protein BGP23_10340 [Xanthomonadales bacterium 66-474]